MHKATASIEKRIELGMAERLKLDKLPRWVHGIGMGGTVLVLLLFIVVFALYKDVPVWADWVPASEFTNPQYAERIYPDSIFRTRMNTWSNLVYVCFGFYAIGLAIYDWKRKLPLGRGYLTFAPVQTFLFGVAGIYLAISNPVVAYNNATFWINKTSKFLEQVVIIDENQTTITYAFSNFKTDQGLSDSTFVFDVTNFDGAIIDLR